MAGRSRRSSLCKAASLSIFRAALTTTSTPPKRTAPTWFQESVHSSILTEAGLLLRTSGSIQRRSRKMGLGWWVASAPAEPTATLHATICVHPVTRYRSRVFRDFHFERFTFQLRGEATNAFNLVSPNAPTANLKSALNGQITSAASPRLIQIGARLTFYAKILLDVCACSLRAGAPFLEVEYMKENGVIYTPTEGTTVSSPEPGMQRQVLVYNPNLMLVRHHFLT